MTPIGLLGVLVFTLAATRGLRLAFLAVLLALPFGATAAVTAGPMTLLLAHMLGLMLAGLVGLRWLAGGAVLAPLQLHPATLLLGSLTIWCALSGFALPRLLAGEVMVVPANMGEGMFGVDPAFGTYVRPLAPSSGNVSQVTKAGIVLVIFVAALSVLWQASPRLARRAVIGVAVVHLGLTGAQLALGDAFSSFVHTADYVIHAEQTFAGMRRVIGGFAEPSVHGGFSVALYGYFLASAISGGRGADVVGAGVCGLLCLASLSSTAIAVFGLVSAVGLLSLSARLVRGRMRTETLTRLMVGGSVLGALFVLLGGVGLMVSVVDGLLLSKASSASGLERGYWARHGFDVFWQTGFLGAGMGSVRSNGLFAAIAGNLGLPGLVLSLAFLAVVLAPLPAHAKRRPGGDPGDAATFEGLRAAVASLVCAASLSATGAGLGLGLVLFSALTVATRHTLGVQNSREVTRTVSPGSIAAPGSTATGLSVV